MLFLQAWLWKTLLEPGAASRALERQARQATGTLRVQTQEGRRFDYFDKTEGGVIFFLSSVMRLAPVHVAAWSRPSEAMRLAYETSLVTHRCCAVMMMSDADVHENALMPLLVVCSCLPLQMQR